MTANIAAVVLFVIIGTSVCTNVVEFDEFFSNFLSVRMSSNLMNSLITYFCTNVVEFDVFFFNYHKFREFRGIQFNSGIPS